MQTLRLTLLASGLAVLLPVVSYAQSLSEIQDLSREERRAYMDSMSADERTAMREKWRNEFDAMSDEERAAMREQRERKRAERRARWESMSDEERATLRAKRRDRGDKKPRNRNRSDVVTDN